MRDKVQEGDIGELFHALRMGFDMESRRVTTGCKNMRMSHRIAASAARQAEKAVQS